MFEKLKQLKQLQELQKVLAQERAEVEKEGTKIVITGKLEIETVQLNPAPIHLRMCAIYLVDQDRNW